MPSLKGSILVSALFHALLFLFLLFSSGTGGAKVVYRPEYRVRLVRPEEVPSLARPVKKKKVRPPKRGLTARPKPQPKKVKVALPKKEHKPNGGKKALPAQSVGKKRDRKGPSRQMEEKKEARKTDAGTSSAKPAPSPEQVLEDVLRRIRKKAGPGSEAASETLPGLASAWKQKQKQIEYKAYYDAVERAVRENWIPPQHMNSGGKPEMTVVSITLLPDGRVLKSYIEESSGDPLFDQSVMRAILKSTPFPPPPIGLHQQTFELGLRFHSKPGSP